MRRAAVGGRDRQRRFCKAGDGGAARSKKFRADFGTRCALQGLLRVMTRRLTVMKLVFILSGVSVPRRVLGAPFRSYSRYYQDI
jgi:hypothetical protein